MNGSKRILMVFRAIFGVSTFLILLGLSFIAMHEELAPYFPFFRWYVECGLNSYYYLTNLIIGFIIVLFLTFLYQSFMKILTIVLLWLKLKTS